MKRGRRADRFGLRLVLSSVLLCACTLAGCVKESTNEFLDATTSTKNQAKLDTLRERTSRALNEWSDSAVSGAMDGWSEPRRQAAFREQTARLAHELAEKAVDGLLDGATDPERSARLLAQLTAALEQSLATLSHGLTTSFSPALDQTLDAASRTLAKDLRQQLGPALASSVRDQLMPGVADGLRKDIGPALADVIKQDIAVPLEKDLGPSLGVVVGKSVEAPLERVLDRLERLSDKTKDDAVEAAQKITRMVAISLGVVLLLCLVGGIFAWRKARAQLRTVELLTTTIKRLEGEPGVQRLLGELREKSIGTDEGNYLNTFLDARPSLRARLAHGADPQPSAA